MNGEKEFVGERLGRVVIVLSALAAACGGEPSEGDPPYDPAAEERTDREIVDDWCRLDIRCTSLPLTIGFKYWHDIPACVEHKMGFLDEKEGIDPECREIWRDLLGCASDEHVDSCREYDEYSFASPDTRCGWINARLSDPGVNCSLY